MKLKLLPLRLKACYRILFGKYEHWILINLQRSQLENLLRDEDYLLNVMYHGTTKYINSVIIQAFADLKTEDDIILEKAEFQAEAEHRSKKR